MSKKSDAVINNLQECITEMSEYIGWAQDENEYLRTRIKELETIMVAYGIKIPKEEIEF